MDAPTVAAMSPGEYIAIASFMLNILVAVAGGTWGIAKIKDVVRDAMETHRKEVDMQLDSLGRSFGETAAALREKVNQVELYAAQTYARREGVYTLREELKIDIKEIGRELKEAMTRLETKLDTKT